MGFPLVDKRVFGWGFVAPPAKPAQVTVAPKPVPSMGARASEAVVEAAKKLEKARSYVQKIHDSYQDLVAVMGEERAKQTFDEAQKGADQAQKAYDITVEIAGGSR